MADGEPAGHMANLHLDESSGEMVRYVVRPVMAAKAYRHSKSELKKRQKQREREEKKEAKAAAAPPKKTEKTEKSASAEEQEAELTPNVRA